MVFVPESLRDRSRQAIANQTAETVTILSSLLAVQDMLGYLPAEGIEEVASRTGSSINEVWSVASFYPNFRFTVPSKHMVEVCWGPTCHVMGAQAILGTVLTHLGLEGEGDTEDQEITLKLNTCLGCCPHAPAISVDHRLVGRADSETALRELGQLQSSDMRERDD